MSKKRNKTIAYGVFSRRVYSVRYIDLSGNEQVKYIAAETVESALRTFNALHGKAHDPYGVISVEKTDQWVAAAFPFEAII